MNSHVTNSSHRNDYRKIGRRCGFTLTEISIVLAIIGVIAAGIFVAASTAEYRIELNQGSDEIGMIVGNMRSLYAGQNAPQRAAAQAATGFGVTPTLVQQYVFPSEMLVPTPAPGTIPAAGTIANNPWDQSNPGGSAQIQLVAPVGATPAEFTLRYFNIPAEVCADLVTRNSAPGTDTGLVQISVSSGVTYTSALNQLPVTPVNAATACPVGGTYNIDWFYTLGS